MIDWTKILLNTFLVLGALAIGYLMPVKSPFDKECPKVKPVLTTVRPDSAEVDPLPIISNHTTENIKPVEGWQYNTITQDTINGQFVDIIEKEKTWTYVDTTKDTIGGYIISGIVEAVVTGLKRDTIEVDILQSIEVDPLPYYEPKDTVFIVNTVEIPAKPEEPTVWESPLFWGAIGIIGGIIVGSLLNKRNLEITSSATDLME